MLGLILGSGFACYLLWALRAEDAFRVVNNKLEWTSAGVVVSGEVYNASAAAASVNVEVSFFNDGGRKLADEVIVLDDLSAGSSMSFRTQPRMLVDVKDYTIYIHAGRNMYGN